MPDTVDRDALHVVTQKILQGTTESLEGVLAILPPGGGGKITQDIVNLKEQLSKLENRIA